MGRQKQERKPAAVRLTVSEWKTGKDPEYTILRLVNCLDLHIGQVLAQRVLQAYIEDGAIVTVTPKRV